MTPSRQKEVINVASMGMLGVETLLKYVPLSEATENIIMGWRQWVMYNTGRMHGIMLEVKDED